MDVDDSIKEILKHRQAFSFGVVGAHTLFEIGVDGGEPMRPLRSNICNNLVHAGFFLPKARLNTKLEQATVNRLAMQLVVGVGDAVKSYYDDWEDHAHPTIRFLRIIRNGAAHDNRVEYSQDDPRPNTEWMGFELTEDLEGQPIFTDVTRRMWSEELVDTEDGFMEAGDALQLSTDVLEVLLPDSSEFDEGNVIGLSIDDGWDEEI